MDEPRGNKGDGNRQGSVYLFCTKKLSARLMRLLRETDAYDEDELPLPVPAYVDLGEADGHQAAEGTTRR